MRKHKSSFTSPKEGTHKICNGSTFLANRISHTSNFLCAKVTTQLSTSMAIRVREKTKDEEMNERNNLSELVLPIHFDTCINSIGFSSSPMLFFQSKPIVHLYAQNINSIWIASLHVLLYMSREEE